MVDLKGNPKEAIDPDATTSLAAHLDQTAVLLSLTGTMKVDRLSLMDPMDRAALPLRGIDVDPRMVLLVLLTVLLMALLAVRLMVLLVVLLTARSRLRLPLALAFPRRSARSVKSRW